MFGQLIYGKECLSCEQIGKRSESCIIIDEMCRNEHEDVSLNTRRQNKNSPSHVQENAFAYDFYASTSWGVSAPFIRRTILYPVAAIKMLISGLMMLKKQ